MTADPVLVDVAASGVATVSLNRPERHNALDAALIARLTETAAHLGSVPAVRVVVLTGAGKSFCAGGDLTWMRAQFETTRTERIAEAMALSEMLDTWNRCPKPVVAKVQGNAFGGGVGLISVCDVALAADTARFGLTETRLGLIPATISPFVVARMGEGACRDTWLTAHSFDAMRAAKLGLLRAAIPAAELDATMDAVTDDLLARSPAALAQAKELARRLGPVIDADVLRASAETLADVWETPDAVEGVSAFLTNRAPDWPSAGGV